MNYPEGTKSYFKKVNTKTRRERYLDKSISSENKGIVNLLNKIPSWKYWSYKGEINLGPLSVLESEEEVRNHNNFEGLSLFPSSHHPFISSITIAYNHSRKEYYVITLWYYDRPYPKRDCYERIPYPGDPKCYVLGPLNILSP